MVWLHLTLCVLILGSNITLATDVKAATLKSKVVDAETNEPIEGAVVVVVWMRPVFRLCMDSCQTIHDAAETVTDAQGNFSIDISMGLLANERKITIYRPGYYRPSYNTAPWLISREDPPLGESQLVRLIKAPSLQDESKGYSYVPRICAEDETIRQWCVPPQKLTSYARISGIARRLQAAGPDIRDETPALLPLHEAASRADLDSVRTHLKRGGNRNEQDKDGRTALMLVLNQILIDRTARRSMLRATREPQRVPEMRAKQYHEGSMSNREILRTLLAAGANPNLKAKNGDTALIIAFPTKRETSPAMNSKIPGLTSTDVYSPELVNELLAGGADPNLRTNYGLTPLMIAASRGLFEIVKTLLDYGADVNIKADFALTAYDVAEGEGVIEALKKARGPRK